MTGQLRERPGDQPLPVPNSGPSMHDLVIADLGVYSDVPREKDAVTALLLERKRLGLERYGSLLQAGNDRDARRDLLEELADAAVYAMQLLEERNARPDGGEAAAAYGDVMTALFAAHRIPEARDA